VKPVVLAPESVDAVARRVVEMMRNAPADSDPWLTREQAASYLNVSPRSFDRKRKEHTAALKSCSKHPLGWCRNALELLKLTNGAGLPARRGRRRQDIAA
jgi:hypothetical protein